MQTSDPRTKLFTGPIDCAKKIIQHGGIKSLYHALPATLLFRTSFAVMFSSYQSINNFLRDYSSNHPDSIFAFSQPVAQFLSGGISAELFWLVALPFDIVKNRIMCDSFTKPRYPTWRSAAQAVWIESGPQGFYKGFTPVMIRAFPTNAAALVVWEGAMRLMKT